VVLGGALPLRRLLVFLLRSLLLWVTFLPVVLTVPSRLLVLLVLFDPVDQILLLKAVIALDVDLVQDPFQLLRGQSGQVRWNLEKPLVLLEGLLLLKVVELSRTLPLK